MWADIKRQLRSPLTPSANCEATLPYGWQAHPMGVEHPGGSCEGEVVDRRPCCSGGEPLASHQRRSRGSCVFSQKSLKRDVSCSLLPLSHQIKLLRSESLCSAPINHILQLQCNLSTSFWVNTKLCFFFFATAQMWPLRIKSFYLTCTLSFYLENVPVAIEAILLPTAHNSGSFPSGLPPVHIGNRFAVTLLPSVPPWVPLSISACPGEDWKSCSMWETLLAWQDTW